MRGGGGGLEDFLKKKNPVKILPEKTWERVNSIVRKIVFMGHYQKMEQSLSPLVYSHALCPRFVFCMYNIIIRGALVEPHAISRFRVCYL